MDGAAPQGFERLHAHSGFGLYLGDIWVDWDGLRIGFRVGDAQVNPRRVCHGGALTTFADYQIVPIMGRSVAVEKNPPTVSLSMDYLAPVLHGAWVEGQVSCLRETRSLVFSQVLMSVDGEPVARSSAVYKKFRPGN